MNAKSEVNRNALTSTCRSKIRFVNVLLSELATNKHVDIVKQ